MNRATPIIERLKVDLVPSNGHGAHLSADDGRALLELIEKLSLECVHWRRGCTGKHGSQAWCCEGSNDLNGLLPSQTTGNDS